jgi:hypothetical protein
MRADSGDDETVPAFTLSCPGYHGPRNHVGGSCSAGNLSFCISNAVVAQIEHDDLLESWQEAARLTPAAALKMSEQAGERLADIMEMGLEAADLAEAVADAAVVFLLAMKRQGISDPKRIPPCTVMWNGQDHTERVLLGA